MAICGAHNDCPNVLVSSEFGAPTNEGYTPQYLFYVTLHELGHALGLGHATNLEESTDLMGYGWIGEAPDPVFSQCDLDALAYLFGPLLAGDDPSSRRHAARRSGALPARDGLANLPSCGCSRSADELHRLAGLPRGRLKPVLAVSRP